MNTKQEALQTIDSIITDLENIESEYFLKKIDSTLFNEVINHGIQLMEIITSKNKIDSLEKLALIFYIQETTRLKLGSFNLRFLKFDYEKLKN